MRSDANYTAKKKLFSYRDLINFIKRNADIIKEMGENEKAANLYPASTKFTFLQNQFFSIISLPSFKYEYTSPNIARILGIPPDKLTPRNFLKLIHPEDKSLVLLATKKMVEILYSNYSVMEPQKVIIGLDYRIKKNDNSYIRILNQNSLYRKSTHSGFCKILSLNTDITKIKSSSKIEFELLNYGVPIKATFPDKELLHMAFFFTQRECDILTLLADGLNSTEIGKQLFISKHTVDTHRRRMLSKSKIGNTAKLIAFAIENRFI